MHRAVKKAGYGAGAPRDIFSCLGGGFKVYLSKD